MAGCWCWHKRAALARHRWSGSTRQPTPPKPCSQHLPPK